MVYVVLWRNNVGIISNLKIFSSTKRPERYAKGCNYCLIQLVRLTFFKLGWGCAQKDCQQARQSFKATCWSVIPAKLLANNIALTLIVVRYLYYCCKYSACLGNNYQYQPGCGEYIYLDNTQGADWSTTHHPISLHCFLTNWSALMRGESQCRMQFMLLILNLILEITTQSP